MIVQQTKSSGTSGAVDPCDGVLSIGLKCRITKAWIICLHRSRAVTYTMLSTARCVQMENFSPKRREDPGDVYGLCPLPHVTPPHSSLSSPLAESWRWCFAVRIWQQPQVAQCLYYFRQATLKWCAKRHTPPYCSYLISAPKEARTTAPATGGLRSSFTNSALEKGFKSLYHKMSSLPRNCPLFRLETTTAHQSNNKKPSTMHNPQSSLHRRGRTAVINLPQPHPARKAELRRSPSFPYFWHPFPSGERCVDRPSTFSQKGRRRWYCRGQTQNPPWCGVYCRFVCQSCPCCQALTQGHIHLSRLRPRCWAGRWRCTLMSGASLPRMARAWIV